MTEDEAKTKWCPFARVSEITPDDIVTPASNRTISEFDDGSSNFYAERKAGAHCIASACMAWRSTPAYRDTERVFETPEEGIANGGWTLHCEPSDLGPRYYSRRITVPAGGFCGLAGTPK